ncbi:MAG: hypothetical protein AVDCRST_MAG71-236, partial [uncultured Lysobacter sp.]
GRMDLCAVCTDRRDVRGAAADGRPPRRFAHAVLERAVLRLSRDHQCTGRGRCAARHHAGLGLRHDAPGQLADRRVAAAVRPDRGGEI